MCDKVKKIICCIAVVIVFFSGMCFGDVKADSFFAHAQTGEYDAFALYEESSLAEVEVLSTENIGAGNTSLSRQIANKGIHIRKELCVLLESLPVSNIVLHFFSKFYMVTSAIPFPEEYGHVIVLNYIHSMDGKKQV